MYRPFLTVVFGLAATWTACAANQTSTVSPIETSGLPYQISLSTYDMGSAQVPTLQSFASGMEDGLWVVVAGRTNGLHGFSPSGTSNFPPQYQNSTVWVIDPVSRQTWSRSLTDPSSGLNASQVDALSATNTASVQRGSTLYVAGGYVFDSTSNDFVTYNTLSALDLDGVVNWVQTGAGSLSSHLRQTTDSFVQVAGGEMRMINNRAMLVFGQNFEGPYTPGSSGVYTHQVRTFDIVDNGVTLSITNPSANAVLPEYRRRDLNVVPMMTGTGAQREEGLIALAGVFTDSVGAWTVPVEISADGTPTMADPHAPGTFKQGMNMYRSASISMYSEATGETHSLLLGGISLQTYDEQTGQFVTDDNMPFTSQSTSVIRDADGHYVQYYLGDSFPSFYPEGSTDPYLFGAEAQFFSAPGLALYPNGMINYDGLTGPTVLGWVYGGIMAELPNDGPTGASGYLFEVLYTPVPEPGVLGLCAAAGLVIWAFRRRS